jgi:hypothetical protein
LSRQPKDAAALGAARNECGKIAYDARWKAKRAEREGRKMGRDHLAPYLCPDCDRWHLAHANRLTRHSPIKAQSVKRQREQRLRAKMLRETFGPNPLCVVPGCGWPADDAHEARTRARGGSITDPANVFPLCRAHHDVITFAPESEKQWAYDLGLLRHSWEDSA